MLGITNVSNAPSIVLKNTSVSSWTSGSYNGFSYRGSIPITGVTADMIAEVTFSQSQAESGNYSSVCTTYDGGLYIYAKVNTNITIPSIIIHSIVESYYSIDTSPPTNGKTTAISSGAVYDALLSYSRTETTINGCPIRTETMGKMVVISTQNADPTATGDYKIATGLQYAPGLVPLVGGDGTLKGYLYGDLYGQLFMRNNVSGNVDIGFRAVYFKS